LQHEDSELEKTPSKIYEMLQKAFFDDSVWRTKTVKWYS